MDGDVMNRKPKKQILQRDLVAPGAFLVLNATHGARRFAVEPARVKRVDNLGRIRHAE